MVDFPNDVKIVWQPLLGTSELWGPNPCHVPSLRMKWKRKQRPKPTKRSELQCFEGVNIPPGISHKKVIGRGPTTLSLGTYDYHATGAGVWHRRAVRGEGGAEGEAGTSRSGARGAREIGGFFVNWNEGSCNFMSKMRGIIIFNWILFQHLQKMVPHNHSHINHLSIGCFQIFNNGEILEHPPFPSI